MATHCNCHHEAGLLEALGHHLQGPVAALTTLADIPGGAQTQPHGDTGTGGDAAIAPAAAVAATSRKKNDAPYHNMCCYILFPFNS